MLHCITCKKIIPTIIDEEFGELPIKEPHLTPEGHDICSDCAAPFDGSKYQIIPPVWKSYVQEHRSPMQRMKQFFRNLVR